MSKTIQTELTPEQIAEIEARVQLEGHIRPEEVRTVEGITVAEARRRFEANEDAWEAERQARHARRAEEERARAEAEAQKQAEAEAARLQAEAARAKGKQKTVN